MTLYKVLNEDGSAFHGGRGEWFLPQGDGPGKWMPRIAEPAPCVRGYHVVKPEMLVAWLGPAIFEVEVRGMQVWQGTKGVVEQARLVRKLERWNDQTARLFACDCAEAVVHLVEDERNVNAIHIARRFAFGLATKEEMAAAWAAARDAAWAAAWAAARDAAWDPAWAAAWDAARDAAWAAAWAAARDAAWDAAWDPAWAAARDAAWDAACAAATAAQSKRLLEYLNGEVDLEAIRRSVA